MLLINYREKKTLKGIIVRFDRSTQNPFAIMRSHRHNSSIGSAPSVMINGSHYIIPSLLTYRFRSIYDYRVNEFKRARRKTMLTHSPMQDATLIYHKEPYSLQQIKKDEEGEGYDKEFT